MESKLLYSVSEAAGLLGISRSKLYQILSKGDLKSVNLGRSRRIDRRALEDFVSGLSREVSS